MNLKYVASSMAIAAGTLIFFAGSLAAAPNGCAPEKASAESSNPNSRAEVPKLVDAIQREAWDVENHAAKLQSLAGNQLVDWQLHAEQLTTVKDEINDIGVKLRRLEQMRQFAPRWERKAIDNAIPSADLMAANAGDAIRFVDSRPDALWLPQYSKYVNNLYDESAHLTRSLKRVEEYAKVHTEDLHMERSLGMQAGS